MLDRVLGTISRYNMLPKGARAIIAVSAGADSVCLLHVLNELFPHSIAGIAHFNHKWRGQDSDDDEQFVAGLASQLNLPFFRAEAPPRPTEANREQAARRDRQAFFKQLNSTIATAHTRDDQAETVLFRLLRGSGLAGLAAIPPTSTLVPSTFSPTSTPPASTPNPDRMGGDRIIRPLIEVTRHEIQTFLRTHNIPWRDDASNRDPAYARNRIRHHLLPQLARDWNPQISDSLAKLADLAYEEERYWTAEIDRIAATELTASSNGIELRVSSLESLPRAVARRLIRRAIALAKGDLRRIDYDHIEAVFHLQRRLKLPSLTVTKSLDWLRFAPPSAPDPVEPLEITSSGVFPAPDGLSQICVDMAQPGPESLSNGCVTLRVESLPLILRGWQPGDHYRPLGQSRDYKVQEMFQRLRVPS